MPSTIRPPKLKDQQDAAEQQIRDLQQEVDYTVREYPVEVIVERYNTGLSDGNNEIFVPEYQRDLVWEEERQSRFIESLLIGLPIPYLFVADIGNEDPDLDGRLEIVDGTQRIRTLAEFIGDNLELQGLSKLTALNGFFFSELPVSRQRRFRRITLRLIELTEQAREETRRDMFDRINTGSMKLNDMETRRGTMPGPFIDLVKELAKDPKFVALAPVSTAQERRYEREELVARFFALYDGYETFGQTSEGKIVSDFVDAHSKRMNACLDAEQADGPTKRDLRAKWYQMLEFVESHFPHGFSKSSASRSTPRVRFEAIAVGSARALADNPHPQGIELIGEWLASEEFKTLTTSDAANNRSRVLARINFVRQKLRA